MALPLILKARTKLANAVIAMGVLLFMSGCPGHEVAPIIVAPVGPATATQLATQAAQIVQLQGIARDQQDLAENASAAVYGATDANSHNPTGLPKDAVDAQLSEASSALPPPTAEQKLAKELQNTRILAGELVAVRTEMGQRVSENEALKGKLATAEQQAREAEQAAAAINAAAEKERADAAAKLKAAFDQKDKDIADLKGAWTRNTQLWAARALVAAGILVVLGGAVVVWISGLSALGKAGGIALSGVLLIGSGLIVGHKYFLPVAGSALGVGLIAGCWYLWHVRRTQQIAKGAMAAIQDQKDAAAEGAPKAIAAAAELKDHLSYRFPRKADGNASAIEQEIDRRLEVDGVNAPPAVVAT